jgi:glycosyltransferase involved in cell wall biosynthesis
MRTVHHFGNDPHAPGGISTALRSYRRLDVPGFRFEFHHTYHPDRFAWSALPFARAGATVLTIPRADLVHVHLSHRGSFVREGLLALAAHRRGLAVAVTIHAGLIGSFVEQHRRTAVRVLRAADGIAVLNEKSADLVRGLVPDPLVQVVPYAVDAPVDAPPPSSCGPTALFAGVRTQAKGLDTLVAAWGHVRRAVPDATLVVAGPASDMSVGHLPGCQVFDNMPHAALLDLLTRSRVATLPSRGEAMPLFVLEAMARARPVVTTPVGALADLVGDDAGRLVPVGDDRALAGALVRYLADPEAADRDGRIGQARVYERCAFETVAKQISSFYQRVLDRRIEQHDARSVA